MNKQANGRQVGGAHYKSSMEVWDFIAANDLDYFQGSVIKYVARWKKKGGVEDLKKAQHFLDKYLEVIQKTETGPILSPFEEHLYKTEQPDVLPLRYGKPLTEEDWEKILLQEKEKGSKTGEPGEPWP